MPSLQRSSRPGSRPAVRRRGAILSLELMLVLPILLIVTVAVIQFGLLFAHLEQVSLASRVGSAAAAESVQLAATMDGDPVPDDIVSAVTQQLCSSGIEWCRIRLEHNVGGTPVELVSETGAGCECGPTTVLPLPPHDDEQYVRLTVCVPLTELIPSSLSFFGIAVADEDKVTGFTHLRRVEP